MITKLVEVTIAVHDVGYQEQIVEAVSELSRRLNVSVTPTFVTGVLQVEGSDSAVKVVASRVGIIAKRVEQERIQKLVKAILESADECDD